MISMFNGCYSLQYVPAFNCTSVTTGNFTNMFLTGSASLHACDMINTNFSISYTNGKLSATELNNIYTNLPVKVGQTITVTGNYGVTGDDPTIATAKGWTVVS